MNWLPTLFRRNEAERTSRLAVFFGVIYSALVIGVSLFPFQNWRDTPDEFGAFLFYDWPLYFTQFDIVINVLAYIPLGIAIALLAKKRSSAFAGLLSALLLGTLLSLMMELIQQYLPGRIPSKLDLSCNAAGSLLGGLFVLVLHRQSGWRYLRDWRDYWFYNGTLADFGLAVIGLWFFSQLDPAIPLFGVVVRPQGLPQPFISPIKDPALFLVLLESIGAFLHLVGVGWLVGTVPRRSRHGLFLIYIFIGIAIFIKLLFAGMLLIPSAFFEWVNPAVAGGWLTGLILFFVLRNLKRLWQTLLAMLALIGSIIVGFLWPLHANPMGDLELFKWSFGQLGHFKGLVSIVSVIWPYLALCYLAFLLHRLLRHKSNQLPSF